MIILSLFDGMSCGQIALNRVGIKVDKYYASEIDKHAIKVTQSNFPDTIQLGDITKISTAKLGHVDLVIGGSPCQGFSFAGKQLNFDDPRSKLFFEYVRVLRELKLINPDIKFLLENVKMKKEYQDVISQHLGVQPIEINSALVSAQNRKRLYWTNIQGVTVPKDRGILLKTILQDGYVDRDKSYCIDANYWKGGNAEQYFDKSRRQLVFKDIQAFGAAQRGRHLVNGKRQDFLGARTEQRIEVRDDEKSNCLTTVAKDSMVLIVPEATNCLIAANYDFMQYKDGLIRKFTPVECSRLQTVPDDYFYENGKNIVSNTQIYRQLGNGWTVDIISWIFGFMEKK